MNSVLKPENTGGKAIVQQVNEAEKEEQAKLRRLKEREGMAFLAYLKIRMDEEELKQESERTVSALQRDFYRMHLEQVMEINGSLLKSLAEHDAKVRDFIFGDEPEENMVKRRELMQSSNIDKDEFCALAMADLCRNRDNKEQIENIFAGRGVSDNLKGQRSEALKHADEAVLELSRGDIRKMEKLVKDGLSGACHAFAHASDALNAVHWSKHINKMLSVVSSHPLLFKNGADAPMFEAAAGMAALGRVMENGMNALNELCTAQLNGVTLTPEKEMNLQAQVLLMQQTDKERSNEVYQRSFAKAYHPKKGINQKKLDDLIKSLYNSKAMRRLSPMSREEKTFVLSDSESCKAAVEGLFVRHEEKKAAEREKAVEKQGPGFSA